MENPIKMDDLGVPLFLETPTSRDGKNTQVKPIFFSAIHKGPPITPLIMIGERGTLCGICYRLCSPRNAAGNFGDKDEA